MFPVGHVASCEIKDIDSCILHLSVHERSPQLISVYVTDTSFVYTAEIHSEELQKVTSDGNTTSLECLRQSVASQCVALSVPQKTITITLKHNEEVITLPVTLQEIDSVDEKSKLLKWILIQLVNKAQANPMIDEQKVEVSKLTAPPRYEEASLYMPRVNKTNAVRKRKMGMSIVNPASRWVKIQRGVQFEND